MRVFTRFRDNNNRIKYHTKAVTLAKGIFLACSVILLTTGCNNSNKPINDQDNTAANVTTTPDTGATTQGTPSPTTEAPELNEDPATSSNDYEITTASFNQGGIQITYPQLKGSSDETGEMIINDLIKNDILTSQVEEVFDSYGEDSSEIKLNETIEYEVTLSTKDILSIMYTGTAYVEGGMYPNNVFHGITIDLKHKNKLYLTNFTDIDTGLAQKIKQSETVSNEAISSQGDKDQEGKVREEIMNTIKEETNRDMLWGLEHNKDSNFYVTEDSLVVSVEISHAAGDYLLVEIPGDMTADLEHKYDSNLCLNTENLLISFKMKTSGKTLSLCTSKDDDYLVYRYGTKDQIDLEYPEEKEESFLNFTYSNNTKGEDKTNSAFHTESVTFKNKDYEYKVYEKYDEAKSETTVGVLVTEIASGKETDIIGDPDTIIGYWYELSDNKKINIKKQ